MDEFPKETGARPPEEAEAPARPPRRRGRRIGRAVGWLAGGLALVVFLASVVAYLLVQTGPGHDFVLRTILNQTPRFVEGSVEVGGLRSDGLLRGFVLHDVTIRDTDGRPFVEADSLRVRYRVREMLTGSIGVGPVELWRPRVALETLHGQERSNVQRIFMPDARVDEDPREDPDLPVDEVLEEPSELEVFLRDVTIHDGEFVLRLPYEGEEEDPVAGVLEEIPGVEGRHIRFRFSQIHGRLNRLDILRPGVEGERVDVQRLSLVGEVMAEPFILDDLRGVLERSGPALAMELDRLWLPGTELAGRIRMSWLDPEAGLELDVAMDAPVVDLADLRWLEPRIPDGQGALALEVRGPLARSNWRIRQADLRVGDSRVRGQVGLNLGEELRLVGVDLRADPLALELVDPWLPEPLPIQGRLVGRMTADGPLAALRVDGRLSWDDPAQGIPASTVDAQGVLALAEPFGVQDLNLSVDPLRYGTLAAFLPDLPVTGEGSLALTASGNMAAGFTLEATATHRPTADGPASRVSVDGMVTERSDGWDLLLDALLDPLSLDGVGSALAADLPLTGDVSGRVEVTGLLEDLGVEVDLATVAGQVAARGRVNILDPSAGVEAEGELRDFALHLLLPDAPDPTTINGTFDVVGSGFTLDAVEGRALLDLRDVLVGPAEVTRATARLEAREGVLTVDTLQVESPLALVSGSGSLGLREDAPEGEIRVVWDVESIRNLRPLLLGEEVAAGDTLTDIDRLELQFQGIDPDTLPQPVALDGRGEGEIHLWGGARDFTGEATMRFMEAVYGDVAVEELTAELSGGFRGRDAWSIEGSADAESVRLNGLAFESVAAAGAYQPSSGRAEVDLRRSDDESYRVAGDFELIPGGVVTDLEELRLVLEGAEWTLDRSARIRVADGSGEVDVLRLTRPIIDDEGSREPGRIEARGRISLDGESEFRLEVESADIHRLAGIAQVAEPPRGFLDLELDVTGPHDGPRIDGAFVLREFRNGFTAVSRLEGALTYRDLVARADLGVEVEGRRHLTAQGRVPVDLSFREVEDRFPDRTLEVDLELDEMPAATALAFLEVLEDVEGVLDGEVRIRGTTSDLRPSGEVRLASGVVALPELGLRVGGINGVLEIREDRTVSVEAEARARGTARVTGTISLEDPVDPAFDLEIRASNFQAVDRRDLNARVGGTVTLGGRFTSPRVGGSVRVDQGNIFIEEFARTAEVVDLTDPDFFNVVDTMLVATRPAIEAAQNPFMQNLRVDVDLILQRDFWLRSQEINVEMGGELAVTFDRAQREIVMAGTLEAIRGAYSAFGRQFQVREGVVEFAGTPGVDPALNIEAVHRLRREGGEPLEIIANLGGTLTNLRVELTSDSQPPIAESDLISYLVFGRPSYALASGESSLLEGAAGVGVSAGVGVIGTQLGQVVAQQLGIDFFTITQTREAGGIESAAGLTGAFAGTQIEVGQYVADNLFLALVLRPLTGLGAQAQNQLPGARLEWRFADLWTLEGFVEDRFAREAASGFGQLGLRLDKVLGFSLYREWGY